MSINRLNYESFAVDYLDGTLKGDQLKEMELFLENNPAIKEALTQMKDLVLDPDFSITFDGKEELIHPINSKAERKERRFVFWIGLAAAILAGSLILLKVFMPFQGVEHETPIVIEEKADQPQLEPEVLPVIPEPNIEEEVPELVVDVTAPDNTPVVKNEKLDQPTIIETPKAIKEVVTEEKVPTLDKNPEVIVEVIHDKPIDNHKESPKVIKEEKPNIIDVAPPIEVVQAPQPKVDPEIKEIEKPIAEEVTTPVEEMAVASPSSSEKESIERLDPPQTHSETLAVAVNDTEEIEENESKTKNKKKKRPLFPRFKERFSKSSLTNALLPEAYSGGSDE
ncbi:MAG: hypothetical protein AAF502_13815 [Bacteroidota bacterium]